MDKQSILNNLDIQGFYSSEIRGLKFSGKDTASAICPFHEDTNPSLSVNQKTGYFNCFSCGTKGSIFDFIMKKYGIDFSGAMSLLAEKAGITDKAQKPERIHRYYDESGKPLYRKLIYKSGNKKSAVFERYEGGAWLKGLQGKPQTLYNIPKLKADTDSVVFISESEKDADNLTGLNLLALSSGGAASWRPEFAEFFKGRQVCILPHNDDAGRKYEETVARSLQGKAASIRTVDPANFGTVKGADFSDWIAQSGTKERLLEIVNEAQEWTPAETPDSNQGRLKITGIADMLTSEPVKYLIDKILIKDTLTMLSAYAATGKSILSLAIAKAILTGESLFDSLSVSETGPVLVIDEENPAAFIKERLEGFGFRADMQLYFLHYQGVKLDNDSLFNELIEVIKNIKPKLIIIDSLIRIHSQKENEAGMSSVMGKLRELVRTGATVLVIHHHRKGAGDIKEGIRGHSDIIGGVDMAITLEQKEDYLLVSHAKSRTVSHEPIRIELQTSGGMLSYKCHGNESNDIIEVILSLLKEHPDGMKQTEILKAIKETGDLDYGDKKIRQTLRSGADFYWDSQPGGQTRKAIIYKVKNEMRQCGNTIYRETLPHYKKDPATLGGNESLQTLDNTKCGNVAEGIKNHCHITEIPNVAINPPIKGGNIAALETAPEILDLDSLLIGAEVVQ